MRTGARLRIATQKLNAMNKRNLANHSELIVPVDGEQDRALSVDSPERQRAAYSHYG